MESFDKALEREDWNVAVALYGGELLQGLRLEGSVAFTAWLELERKRLRAGWRQGVLHRAAELEQCGRHLQAAKLVEPFAAVDELDEDALQVYLRKTFFAGHRNEALELYRRFAAKYSSS